MTHAIKNVVHNSLPRFFDGGNLSGLSDGALLERFATRDGEAAELAFTALVERHGPTLLRICRAMLRNDHDAEDAFQATFLVLARKAPGLRVRESLAPWIHAVGRRVAARAKQEAGGRRKRELRAAERAKSQSEHNVDYHDLQAVLYEELTLLPEKYRIPIELCDLAGETHEDVARWLGWPVGTVKSRHFRGRERLRGPAKSSRSYGPLRDLTRGFPGIVSARADSGSARRRHDSRGGAVCPRSYDHRSRPDVRCRLRHRNPEGHVRDKADDNYRYSPDHGCRRRSRSAATGNAVGTAIKYQRSRA